MRKVLIISNYAWTVYNFRLPLIRFLRGSGFEVEVLTKRDEYVSRMESLGIRCHPLRINLTGEHLFQELRLMLHLFLMVRRINPDYILSFTIKPNLYMGFANFLLRKKWIANITGVGEIARSILYRPVLLAYRFSLLQATWVFFQNKEDMETFRTRRAVRVGLSSRIFGSGIDLAQFSYTPHSTRTVYSRFIMAARLLPQKGFYEFMRAAEAMNCKAEFVVFGKEQEDRTESMALYGALQNSTSVRFGGFNENIKEEIARSHFVVFPSYYDEGLPRFLLEALAVGRPIITTDWKGCRDVVEDGINGFLVRPRAADSLREAIRKCIEMRWGQYESFCRASRRIAEEKCDEKVIFQQYLEKMNS